MSDALSPDAPATDAATPEVSVQAPVDGTAVTDGSAGSADVVPKDRFNGLMSAHQRTLAELEAERQARAALEAQLNSKETHTVADDELRDEVRTLQDELRAERLERAKEKALAKYPEAAPLADLIIGSTAVEVETVAKAIAERLKALNPAPTPTPDPTPEPVADATPAPVADAPVIGGGGSATPAEPTVDDAVRQALSKGDWSEYWSAKAGAKATANLG